MTSESWRDERFLDEMRRVADPLCDGLVFPLLENSPDRFATIGWLNSFLQRWEAPIPSDYPQGIQDFLRAPIEFPDWVDRDKLVYSQNWFKKWGLAWSLGLFVKALPQFLAHTRANPVFHRANLFNANSTKRFLVQIAQLTFDVMRSGGLEIDPPTANFPYSSPKAPGVVALQKLRLHHSIIRFEVVHNETVCGCAESIGGGDWDPAWGEPLNQEDLAAAVLAFSLWTQQAIRSLGEAPDRKRAEASLHLWKVMGFLLGLDERLQVANVDDAQELLEIMHQRHFVPAPAGKADPEGVKRGKALIAELLDLVQGFFPRPLKRVPVEFILQFVDPFFVDVLGIPRRYGPTWLIVSLFRFRIMRRRARLFRVLGPFLTGRILLGLRKAKEEQAQVGSDHKGALRVESAWQGKLSAGRQQGVTGALPPVPRPSLFKVDWGRALHVGFLATLVYVVAALLLRVDVLGYGAVLARGASDAVQNVVGAISTLAACAGYVLLYVVAYHAAARWRWPLKTLVFAVGITTLSIIFMPGAAKMTALSTTIRLLTFVAFSLVLVLQYRSRDELAAGRKREGGAGHGHGHGGDHDHDHGDHDHSHPHPAPDDEPSAGEPPAPYEPPAAYPPPAEADPPAVIVDLGRRRPWQIRRLKRGRGPLLDEVGPAIEQARPLLGDEAADRIVPVVVLYRRGRR